MKQYLALILAAFLLANSTIFVRFLVGIDVFLITLFVLLFASVFFFIAAILTEERIKLKNKKLLIVFGASQLGTWGFLYAAILVSFVSTSMFLFYTAPVFALVMSPIFLKEKISKISVISIAIAMFGALLIFNPIELFQFLTFPIGFIFSLFAAFSYGLNIILGRMLKEYYKPFSLSFFSHFIGFILLLLIIPFLSNFQNITIPNISILLLMGLLSGIGYALIYYSLRYLVAQRGAIIMLAEPLFATILAVFLFQEVPTIFTVTGGILILIAVAITSSFRRRISH